MSWLNMLRKQIHSEADMRLGKVIGSFAAIELPNLLVSRCVINGRRYQREDIRAMDNVRSKLSDQFQNLLVRRSIEQRFTSYFKFPHLSNGIVVDGEAMDIMPVSF